MILKLQLSFPVLSPSLFILPHAACDHDLYVYVPVWQDILWNFSRLFFSFLSFATLICHSTGGHHTEPHPFPLFLSLSLSLPSNRLDTEGIELLLSFLKVSTSGVNPTPSYTLFVGPCDVMFYLLLFSLPSTSPKNGFLLMIQ